MNVDDMLYDDLWSEVMPDMIHAVNETHNSIVLVRDALASVVKEDERRHWEDVQDIAESGVEGAHRGERFKGRLLAARRGGKTRTGFIVHLSEMVSDGIITVEKAHQLANEFEARIGAWVDDDSAKGLQLAMLEGEIVTLLRADEALRFRIVRMLYFIRAQKLYEAKVNDAKGACFASFSEYLPVVLREWHAQGLLSASSTRQMYDYLRVYGLFVEQLGLDEETIAGQGVSHFIVLAQALPVDKETGQIRLDLSAEEAAAEGKMSVGEVLALVDEIRSNSGWTVATTADRVNERKGKARHWFTATWVKQPNGCYQLQTVIQHTDEEGKIDVWLVSSGPGSANADVADEETMRRFCRKLGCEPYIVE